MNAMKKLVYSLLVLCSAGLLAWACNSMDESVAVTALEESLNLQAPSGMKIANSMLDLKEFLGKDMDFPMDEFEITDISKTLVCPLAKIIRKELRNRNIEDVKVVYSKEEPIVPLKDGQRVQVMGSISFVPGAAGLLMAGEVTRSILIAKGKKNE